MSTRWSRVLPWRRERPVPYTPREPATARAALREVLALFSPATVCGRVAFYQATEHPIHPDDMDRWRGALSPTEAEVEDIKARWREAHGKPGTAHVVTEIHTADHQPVPGFRPARPDIPAGIHPDASPLVVEPYRADDGSRKWVFRCWGTDSCDGWLSLDHYSRQSAERARDRHVAEEHAQEQPMPDSADPPVQCWHTEPDTPCDWNVCRQPERLAADDRGTDPARKEPS